MLFLLLWLCSIIQSQVLWNLQHCPFAQNFFGSLESFMFPYEFKYRFFHFCEEWHWNFGGDCIESVPCTW
jgi:hypothetical protein